MKLKETWWSMWSQERTQPQVTSKVLSMAMDFMLTSIPIADGDFELLMTNLTIPQGSRNGDSVCFNVTIIGDNVLEDDETFTVELTTITQDVVVDGSGSVTITILHDGDCKQSTINFNCSETAYDV